MARKNDRGGSLRAHRPTSRGVTDVSEDQYELGYQIWASSGSIKALIEGAEVTKGQAEALVHRGDHTRKLKAYKKRLIEEASALGSQRVASYQQLSEAGPEVAKGTVEMTNRLRAVANAIINEQGRLLQTRLQQPEDERGALSKSVLGPAAREMLRMILPYAYGEKFWAVQAAIAGGQPKAAAQAAGQGAFIDVGGVPQVVGTLALAEATGGSKASPEDMLRDLFPESEGWSVEQLEQFAMTGKRPEQEQDDDE